MNHTDIKQESWITRQLPESWQPYAFLMRLDRPIGWWLLLLPGWWGISLASGGINNFNWYSWYMMILFLPGAIIMRAAGCIINDIWDKDLDKQVERTKQRPLASGKIKTWQAAILLFSLLFIALIILLQTPGTTILLGIFATALTAAYPYMKRITFWPQAFLGITFAMGTLMGWSAITGKLDTPSLLLYASGFFWVMGFDTIYAHQDKKDDLIAGIKSTALLFRDKSKIWVSWFYLISFALLALCFNYTKTGLVSYSILLLAGIYAIIIIKNWNMDDPKSSLDTFKSNRNHGIIILTATLLSDF